MIIKNDIVNKNEEGLKVADKMCEFKIQELGLRNYRRFDKKKFVLNPRMNVLLVKMVLVRLPYWRLPM